MDILININDFDNIITNYFADPNNGLLISLKGDDKKKICKFVLDKKECQVTFYIKVKGVNPQPIGKNKELCENLIKHLEVKGIKDNMPSNQLLINDASIFTTLLSSLESEYSSVLQIKQNGNIYKIVGYNNDTITITLNKNNFLIQGKPYFVFHTIIAVLAESNIDLDEYVNITNKFANINTPSQAIRDTIKNVLKNSYTYLTEPAIKNISTSFSYIGKNVYSENYACALAGVFIALEGYLKKLLTQEYSYVMKNKDAFGMFYVQNGKSDIDSNAKITQKEKDCLNNLYKLYSKKRTHYLHSTVDPINLPIIQNYKDAESIRDEILDEIERTYNIIF